MITPYRRPRLKYPSLQFFSNNLHTYRVLNKLSVYKFKNIKLAVNSRLLFATKITPSTILHPSMKPGLLPPSSAPAYAQSMRTFSVRSRDR
jgi:hypothetical protein